MGAWGVWGHKHINKAAVMLLPDSMRTFYYNHIDFIVEESVVPDIRKYTIGDEAEPNRHFIDLEAFRGGSTDSLPATLDEARKIYDADFLKKNGILPWYIEQLMDKLTKAFKTKNKAEILFLSADLGHYIGDAHMPLHTSVNYDGQLTGQKGIHAFWESLLPELFGKNYIFKGTKPIYISNIRQHIRNLIGQTHLLRDSVLLTEKETRNAFGPERIFKKDSAGMDLKNRFGSPIFSDTYAECWHKRMHGLVEQQMMLALNELACFWYTAWINAGKPDLTALDPPELTTRNAGFLKKESKFFQKGKLLYLDHNKD
jgi:hypothetical protein